MTVRLGTTPEQLVTPSDATASSGVTRTLYVDGARTDTYAEEGSIGQPFKTIQAAVDYAEASLTPSHTAPVVISIAPTTPIYAEDVVIKKSGVHLSGTVGQGVTNIQRIIITNATLASLQAFITAGGIADPVTHYGLLVADSYEPWDNQFREIAIGDQHGGGGNNTLLMLGVGAGTSFLGNEANFMRCTNWEDTYVRLANYIAMQNDTFCRGSVTLYNVAGLWMNRTQTGNFILEYNSGDDQPADGGNYGLCGGPGSLIYGSVTLNGSGRMGYDRLDALQIASHLDINGTGAARMEGGLIGGNITVEGDATFRLRGVHTQGTITLDNAGGAVGCTYDGGRYMGALTDAGARLTRNLGN